MKDANRWALGDKKEEMKDANRWALRREIGGDEGCK